MMAPHYEYEIIASTAKGYYFNRKDDGNREVELWGINEIWEERDYWSEDLRGKIALRILDFLILIQNEFKC